MASPPLPDFSNITLFPSFTFIPEDDQKAIPKDTDIDEWFLLAQVKDDMTINKPTLVLNDRDGVPFALVFEGLGRDDLKFKDLGFKKGMTAVIPWARRTQPADEAKRGFVRVWKEDAARVRSIPGPLARVLELGGKGHADTEAEAEAENCGACENKGTKKCTGCSRVTYCSKVSLEVAFSPFVSLHFDAHNTLQECQVKGWSEGGHKTDCKIFKALNDIFK